LIKIAIIGFGDIAKNEHLPAIQNSSEFSLVAVVETNQSRHDEISKLVSCSVVKTMKDAVNLGAECVILSTPPEITELLIREAIELNLHILSEKPIGIQFDSLQDLPNLAAGSLSKIQVGFTNRYAPFVQELKAIIESGELGSPLVFMMAAFDEPFNELDKNHLSRIMHFLEHGPAFTHEGSHLIDYLSYFGFQNPLHVSALRMVRSLVLRLAGLLPPFPLVTLRLLAQGVELRSSAVKVLCSLKLKTVPRPYF
jgi:predicted dehydrogenase